MFIYLETIGHLQANSVVLFKSGGILDEDKDNWFRCWIGNPRCKVFLSVRSRFRRSQVFLSLATEIYNIDQDQCDVFSTRRKERKLKHHCRWRHPARKISSSSLPLSQILRFTNHHSQHETISNSNNLKGPFSCLARNLISNFDIF